MAMQIVYLIGRFLLVAIFLVSGVRKLLDLPGTAKLIEPKLWALPAAAQPYVDKLTTMSGMSSPQLVAIVLAIVQIVFALFIIFNVGSRFAAVVLAKSTSRSPPSTPTISLISANSRAGRLAPA